MSTISAAACKAACDAVVDLVDAGTPPGNLILRASSTVIATFPFETTAYGAATSAAPSVATAANFPKNATASAGGVMDNYRIENAAATLIISGTVGESGADINFDNADINNGQTVTMSSLTHTQPAS
jgi:hypothetical protein